VSANEREMHYARAIWGAMVDDEPEDVDEKTLWTDGFLDAAKAVIEIADQEPQAKERHS
jgi:hypothetical protein